jgi:hypothetical protein
MKIIRFLSLVFLLTIISLFSGFVLSSSAQEVLNIRYKPPEITLGNFQQPPEKVLFPKALDFADIAWKTFVTLNWPAKDDGSPLENFVLGQAPLVPRVWEFYRRPEEVFLPNGENPLLNTPNPFATPLNIDLFEGQGSGLEKKSDLQENSKLAGKSQLSLEENLLQSRAWIKKNLDFSYKCQGKNDSICDNNDKYNLISEGNKLVLNKIPIVDQQGNYIIVEMHLNGNEFNQIVDNEWYNASKLAEYDDEKNRFQFKSTTASGDAPIEIKAAWRVFDENSSPGEKARYYTTKRVLAIPAEKYVCTTDNCRTDHPVLETDPPVLKEVEVGLIGFHIAYKIPKQDVSTPGWIWATFEQVDNLQVDNPPPGIDLEPTLSNPACETNANKENSDQENCLPNYPYVEWPFLWRDQSPHAVTQSQDGQIKEQIPTQVQRLSKSTTLSDDVKESLKQQNKNWQEAFKEVTPDSVWQYYQLVGTQWLQNPSKITQTPLLPRDSLISNIRSQQLQPGALFNVSMEAYSQTKVNGDSCIGCHVTAILQSSSDNSQKVTSDFSFLLERAKSSNNNLSKEVK